MGTQSNIPDGPQSLQEGGTGGATLSLKNVTFGYTEVDRCSLPVSKPVLKAPKVSALEAII
jgi:hypothetical protein